MSRAFETPEAQIQNSLFRAFSSEKEPLTSFPQTL
jgi:hypothetical protein